MVNATADRQKNSRIGGIYGWQVTVRVRFADGSTADYERYVEAGPLTDTDGRSVVDLSPGDTLPIRYDPTNRSKVEIDTVALVEQYAAAEHRAEAEATSAQNATVARVERGLKPLDS